MPMRRSRLPPRFLPELTLCLFLPLMAAGALAATVESLWARLAAQDQAQGRFMQELLDEQGELIERSSGAYALLKPGYFRWEIDYPDRQQIVIADDVLWHYDIDLASVTRRAVDHDGRFTALDLLARSSDELADRFSVEVLDGDRFRLVPQFAQAGFSAVILSWDEDRLVAMDVQQRSGQTLSLVLSPDAEAPALTAADFAFVVPEGVDLQTAIEN
jgi:chaperone LolA